MLLAIDTSTNLTGLAWYDQNGLQSEHVWQSGRNQTIQLLPQLDLMLGQLGCVPGDIQAVAVALGPGSWSGLRVGLSVAKGLALAGDVPLFGITTLDALAYQQHAADTPVFPLIRLGRMRFATACYQYLAQWQRQTDYRNVSLDELVALIDTPSLFCGDTGPDVQALLRDSLGEYARFSSSAAGLRRPGYLAEMAWQRFLVGAADDLARLEPLYLGEPVKPKQAI